MTTDTTDKAPANDIEGYLKQLEQTGEKRQVTTSIFSDEDIRSFLFYSSKMLKDELFFEVQHLIINPICSRLTEPISSVIHYDQPLPKERTLLVSWYSGIEEAAAAFRRTDTRYIIAEKKAVHGIVCFRDPKVCQTEFVYLYVSGRFGSESETHEPVYWDPVRLFGTSLRDLLLYVIPTDELKHLGIEL